MHNLNEIPLIRLPSYPSEKGFTCGSFDLLHAGHILLLEYAKSKCKHLIVGLQVDPSVDRIQKNKPIQSLYERHLQLDACKYVDQIVVYETEKDLELICRTLDFDVRFLGKEYENQDFTGKQILLKKNPFFNFEYVDRSHGFSSSELRSRISNKQNSHNYSLYIDPSSYDYKQMDLNLNNDDLSSFLKPVRI